MRNALRTAGLAGTLIANGIAMMTAYHQAGKPTPQQRFVADMEYAMTNKPLTMQELITGIEEARPTGAEGELYKHLLWKVITHTHIELRTCAGDDGTTIRLRSFFLHERDRLQQWQYQDAEERFIRISIESVLSDLERHLDQHHTTRTCP